MPNCPKGIPVAIGWLRRMNKKLVGTVALSILTLSLILILGNQEIAAEQSRIIGTNSDSRLELRIYSFDTAASIDYYPYTPDTSGYIWAWVYFSIKNIGTEEVSTNVFFAYLKDSNDYQYEARITVDSPLELELVDMPPGETQQGLIYWEIPPDAEITSFIWSDYVSYITIPDPPPSPTPTETEAPTLTPKPGEGHFVFAAALYVMIAIVVIIIVFTAVLAYLKRRK